MNLLSISDLVDGTRSSSAGELHVRRYVICSPISAASAFTSIVHTNQRATVSPKRETNDHVCCKRRCSKELLGIIITNNKCQIIYSMVMISWIPPLIVSPCSGELNFALGQSC